MRGHGLAGIQLCRRVRTTDADQGAREHPDLLGCDFTVPSVGEKYVGDITYLPLADGRNLYLATVIDLCSRRLVGWALADHMRTELVADALRAAARDRGRLQGVLFHSDHGSVGGFNWSSQHLPGLRGAVCRARHRPVDGGDRVKRGQRCRGELQLHAQTRDPRRRSRVRGRGGVAAHGVPVGPPLQHPSSLTPRKRVPERLRGLQSVYDGGFGVINHPRVQDSRLSPHKRHGMTIQVVSAPDGEPLWKKNAKLRSPDERALAQLKQRGVLRRLHRCPQRAGQITRSVLILQLREAGWKGPAEPALDQKSGRRVWSRFCSPQEEGVWAECTSSSAVDVRGARSSTGSTAPAVAGEGLVWSCGTCAGIASRHSHERAATAGSQLA